MRFALSVLVLVLAVAGCARVAKSPLNPINAMRAATAPAPDKPLVPPEKIVRKVDTRALVAEVTALEVSPTLGGVIVRAQGRAAAAGAYSAQLVQIENAGTAKTFEFRVFQGAGAGTRVLTVATFVSDNDLGGVRQITVLSQSNRLTRAR